MTYQPEPIQEAGGQKRVWTADDDVQELLRMILDQLTVMNLHLASMTDEKFSVKDADT